MQILSLAWLHSFWSSAVVSANLVVFLNLLGALILGLIVGYERTYHGRAAGMRTYGTVCMASAALTVFAGYPAYWYGGQFLHGTGGDPTRVVQGIVTGVGFLGAGVIMKEGLNISGLTTAASIWASSAIGVLVGIGFYSAAILSALLSAALMMWGSRLEAQLPSRHSICVTLGFLPGCAPSEDDIVALMHTNGYELFKESLAIKMQEGQMQWHFVVCTPKHGSEACLTALASALGGQTSIQRFELVHARN